MRGVTASVHQFAQLLLVFCDSVITAPCAASMSVPAAREAASVCAASMSILATRGVRYVPRAHSTKILGRRLSF